MIIKFNSASLPSQAIIDLFQIRNVQIAPPNVMGYLATDKTGDIHIANDDYFFVNNGDYKIIKRASYLANATLNRFVVEDIAKDLMGDIVQGMVDLAITDAQKLSILNTINVSLTMVAANKLVAARAIANVIPTTADFTAGRKTGLLNLMDAAIARL